MLQKKLIVMIIVLAISGSLLFAGAAQAQDQATSEDLFSVLNKIDIAASSLRKGETDPAKASLNAAFTVYDNKFSSPVAAADAALDNQIINAFTIYSQTPTEKDLLSLRSDVSKAAGLIGVQLSPLFQYAIFIVMGISFLVALFTTLVSKKMVNWKMMKENKTIVDQFQKEMREAQKKRDMKAVHKLQQRQPEIMKLTSQMTTQNLKPSLIIMVVILPLWWIFGGVFKGWVVAWLPFLITTNLPIVGPLVVFGMGWWYVLSSLGFSQILRKVMIGV